MFNYTYVFAGGLPGWLSGKESSSQQKTQVRFLGQEDPLEKEMATHLPGKSHGQRSLAVHGVARVGYNLATKPPPPLWRLESEFNIHY